MAIFKLILSYLCLIVILLETKAFLLNHPISSSISPKRLTLAEQPVLTICFWPSTEVSSCSNAVNNRFLIVVNLVCKNGMTNITKSKELSRCTSIAHDCVYEGLSSYIEVRSRVFECSTVMASLHKKGEPSFVSTAIPVKRNKEIIISVNYALHKHITDQSQISYDMCFHNCLMNIVEEQFNCIPSFLDEILGLQLRGKEYNSTFPMFMSSNGINVSHIYDEFNSLLMEKSKDQVCSEKWKKDLDKTHSYCFISCRHAQTRHTYSSDIKEIEYMLNDTRIYINMVSDTYYEVKEEDWMRFSQLLSSLGGIISCTLGLSLLSVTTGCLDVCLTLLKKIHRFICE